MNSPPPHKVCIYGAGAIGSWLGAGLAQAGSDVSMVARGATLEALRQHGLRLQAGDQPVRATPVQASSHPAELGVQEGIFAEETLRNWHACTRYVLVDAWRPLANYHDRANVDQERQDKLFAETIARLAPWKDKVEVCRNMTTACAPRFSDATFDYVYVEARHDRLGVTVDLQQWWPKVRPGGLLCGHDFVSQWEGPHLGGQDWAVNEDGSRDPTELAVRGAVTDFAKNVSRQISIGYQQGEFWSWCMRR